MKLSVYSLSDALMSFGIIQFEEGEVGEVRKVVEELGIEGVEKVLQSLGIEVEEITMAKGIRSRGSWRAPVVYLSILGSSKKYWLEILDEFADFVCNENVVEAVNTIVRVLKALSPKLTIRRGKSILGIMS